MSKAVDGLEAPEEFKMSFGLLDRGVLYPVLSLERTRSLIHGQNKDGVKAKILGGDLILFTWLPKKVADRVTDEIFDEVNEAGKTNEKFLLCYYGTMETTNGRSFAGRLHRPGSGKYQVVIDRFFAFFYVLMLITDTLSTERDEKFLNDITRIMNRTAQKYQAPDQQYQSPSKRHIEDNVDACSPSSKIQKKN